MVFGYKRPSASYASRSTYPNIHLGLYNMGGWIRGAFPKIKNEDDELRVPPHHPRPLLSRIPPTFEHRQKKSFKTCLEDTWSFPSAKGTVIRKIEMPTRTSISLLKYFL
jgi:hypothetical protein